MVRRQPGKDQGRRDSKGPKGGELGTFGEEASMAGGAVTCRRRAESQERRTPGPPRGDVGMNG